MCYPDVSQTRAAGGFALLSFVFFVLILPIERLAARETNEVSFEDCLPMIDDIADFYVSTLDLPSTGSPRASS